MFSVRSHVVPKPLLALGMFPNHSRVATRSRLILKPFLSRLLFSAHSQSFPRLYPFSARTRAVPEPLLILGPFPAVPEPLLVLGLLPLSAHSPIVHELSSWRPLGGRPLVTSARVHLLGLGFAATFNYFPATSLLS